jgi:hypothetical protein
MESVVTHLLLLNDVSSAANPRGVMQLSFSERRNTEPFSSNARLNSFGGQSIDRSILRFTRKRRGMSKRTHLTSLESI